MTEQTNQETGSESHSKRHALMMLLCCLLPIVAIFALVSIFPGNPFLSLLAVVVCPLSMVLMQIPNVLAKKKESSGCN